MIQPTVGTKAFVVKTTVLHDGGREDAEYKNLLFEVDPITRWVKNNHEKIPMVLGAS